MELYLLRHGIAEDAAPGGSDAARALTAEGKRKLRDLLKVAYAAGVRPGLIISSPYVRAVETSRIAAKSLVYTGEVMTSQALVPHAHPNELWEELRMHRGVEKVLLVSHEPLLSSAVSMLLNSSSLRVDFKKGAIMRIDFEGFTAQPAGLLKWFLTGRLA